MSGQQSAISDQQAGGAQAAPGGQQQQAPNQGAGQGQGDQGQGQPPGPVPYDRFKTVNDELGQLKQRLAQIDQAEAQRKKEAEAAEAKRLTENNEFKTLAEQRAAKLAELEPLGERVKGLEAVIQGVYEARLKDLPEAARKAVEALPGLSVEQKLAWLNENAGLFVAVKQTPLNINATAIGTTGGPTAAKQEEQVELWRRLGLNNAVRAAQQK